MGTKHVNREQVVEIGEGFLTCTLPPDRFDHRAHLLATTYALAMYPDRDWDAELPQCIRAFNLSAGGADDNMSGFHHTITAAYLAVIRATIYRAGPHEVVALCRAVLASPAAERGFLLLFWTPETLFSAEARVGWVSPDLNAAGWSAATIVAD